MEAGGPRAAGQLGRGARGGLGPAPDGYPAPARVEAHGDSLGLNLGCDGREEGGIDGCSGPNNDPGGAELESTPHQVDGAESAAHLDPGPSLDTLDQAAARQQRGLKVFLRDQSPIEPVARRLEGKGDGEINLVLILGGGNEVEVKLPGRFKVSPQIAGAIKAVPGVVEVQLI